MPRFHGPAPIHHVLLSGESTTGVTVQSLHPTKFDQGKILARSEEVFISNTCTYDQLYERLAEVGAHLLLTVLQHRIFESNGLPPIHEAKYAPKVSKQDRLIKWHEWDANKLSRHARAFGDLYCFLDSQNNRMVKLSGFEISCLKAESIPPGYFQYKNRNMVVFLKDAEVVVKKIQIEGRPWANGYDWVRGWRSGAGGHFV